MAEWNVTVVYATTTETKMLATTTSPADRTERHLYPAGSTTWGPFEERYIAEQLCSALAGRADVYEAKIVEVP